MATFVSQPKPALIMPSTTLLCVKPTTGILFDINLNFSLAFQGENVHRGQPRDIERDTECERGREREKEQRKVEEKEIRGKINVTRTRELY